MLGTVLLLLAGHAGGVNRTVMVEPSHGEVHVVLHLAVTGEERKKTTRALYDRNGDGRISGAERRRLESVLVERGFAGLTLQVDGSTQALSRAEVKSQGLEVMVKGTVPSPKAGGFALATSTKAEPVHLVVLAGDRPVRSASRGRPQRGALKITLGPGDRVSWLVAPVPQH